MFPLFILVASETVTLNEDKGKEFQRTLFKLENSVEETVIAVSTSVAIVAGIIFALFLCLRPLLPKVYNLRNLIGEVASPTKPSWSSNMLTYSPEAAFANGYSLDACMHIVAWKFATRVFFWLLLISPIPLYINYAGAGFACPEPLSPEGPGVYKINGTDFACGLKVDQKGREIDSFIRLTMTSFQKGNPLFYAHIALTWIFTAIVIAELMRANTLFKKLRPKWLARREGIAARSVMVTNSTAKTGKEFRAGFERAFPGKVQEAHLMIFCEALVKTCMELEKVELKLADEKLIASEKGEEPKEKRDNNLLKLLTGPSLAEQRSLLLDKKKTQQDEVLAKCEGSQAGSVFSETGFVTFKDRETALLAVSEDWKLGDVTIAPSPEDIRWNDLATKRAAANQDRRWLIVVVAIAIFICGFPIVVIVQGTMDYWLKKVLPAEEERPSWMNWLFGILDPVLKNLVNILFLIFLPKIFLTLSIRSGRMVTNSAYCDVQTYMILFKVIFVVYATSVAPVCSDLFDYALSTIKGETPEPIEFDPLSAFGTSVPSSFPVLYTYAVSGFTALSFGILQLSVYISFAIKRYLLQKPREFSWLKSRAASTGELENPFRYIMLTITMCIGFMVFQVFPFSVIVFLLLLGFGTITLRYRVLYIDNGLVDSGGLFWAQFEIHVVVILLLCQISMCIISMTILKVWTVALFVPLMILSAVYLVVVLSGRKKFFFKTLFSTPGESANNNPSDSYFQPHLK